MDDRRKFRRLPAEAEVRVRPVQATEVESGVSKNISGSGVLFTYERPLEVDSLLDIEVVAPHHPAFSRTFDPLKARVRVVRVEGDAPAYEIAAEFVQMAE